MRSARSSVYSAFKTNGTTSSTLITMSAMKNQKLTDMYAKLSVFVSAIQNLLAMFSAGRFLDVAALLTPQVYESLSKNISDLAADPVKYPEYENIRTSEVLALQGLYQSIRQQSDLVNLENALTTAEECCATLRDPVKLKEYLDMMQRNSNIFPDSTITAAKAVLKPQYAEYLRLYGYPEGGIFDIDKLSAILVSLGIA